jgi:hypothetical protein
MQMPRTISTKRSSVGDVLLNTIITIYLHAPHGMHRWSILRNGCNVRNLVRTQIPHTLPGPGDQIVQTNPVLILPISCILGNRSSFVWNMDNWMSMLTTLASMSHPWITFFRQLGQWYNSALSPRSKPSKDFMMPIIFWPVMRHIQKRW